MSNEQHPERSDKAISDRLSKLRSLPVDTTRVAAQLRRDIPPAAGKTRGNPLLWIFGRPMRAAGVLLVGVLLALLLSTVGGPASASTESLVQLHNQVQAGHADMAIVNVSSMAGASAAIATQWTDAPTLPGVPDEQVIACCVHEIGRTKMACVALTIDGVPVTMAVADGSDVKSPAGQVLERGGVDYRVESSQGVSMAMVERDGRWICLMGRVPIERLIHTVEQMQF